MTSTILTALASLTGPELAGGLRKPDQGADGKWKGSRPSAIALKVFDLPLWLREVTVDPDFCERRVRWRMRFLLDGDPYSASVWLYILFPRDREPVSTDDENTFS